MSKLLDILHTSKTNKELKNKVIAAHNAKKVLAVTTLLSLISLSSQAATITVPAAKPAVAQSSVVLDANADSATKRAYTSFKKRDVNGDGVITWEEYQQTMRSRTNPTAATTPAVVPVRK